MKFIAFTLFEYIHLFIWKLPVSGIMLIFRNIKGLLQVISFLIRTNGFLLKLILKGYFYGSKDIDILHLKDLNLINLFAPKLSLNQEDHASAFDQIQHLIAPKETLDDHGKGWGIPLFPNLFHRNSHRLFGLESNDGEKED
ncbi:uncharacterized protein LOC124637938 [Helicoverpa zea]|uniref:uncharacterized protein LOC124637938 n=1 Tax=Helicoverpa zea TaxID=7113 RepID=UPI001F56C47B|nr:uncharacterized protein LOC124637938 [Helicoverpa zea]